MSDADERSESSDVVAWSSSHLSDDDSDAEEASESSRTPSHSVEEGEEEEDDDEVRGSGEQQGKDQEKKVQDEAKEDEKEDHDDDDEDDAVEDLDDNWMMDLDVDLPDGADTIATATKVHVPVANLNTNDNSHNEKDATTKKTLERELASTSEWDSPDLHQNAKTATVVDDDTRPVEPVVVVGASPTRQEAEKSPTKRPSLIPRLAPPLTRQRSLMSPPKGMLASSSSSNSRSPSASPPRLSRSPSKTNSLVAFDSGASISFVPEPQLSPTSLLKKRSQSVYIATAAPGAVVSRTLTQRDDAIHPLPQPQQSQQQPQQRGMVSTSSQFWASEQTKRSSRLLDEWKRKEIWHDFKRAEETVLTSTAGSATTNTNTTTTASPEPTAIATAETTTPTTALDAKAASASNLDDVLQGIRSDILGKRSDQQQAPRSPPLRRATSFAMKTNATSPNKTAAFHLMGSSSSFASLAASNASKLYTTDPGSVPKAEYDRVVDEKRRLAADAESRQRALVAEQDAARVLHERLLNLENADRENRFLKEEIQRHLMHELSSKELVKTLEDQLALTARSEDQLKLQTRQLMQQNQALQSDLLEKMAGETSKIQKMAHLSAEKQKLQEELQRSETQSNHKVAQQQERVRATVLRHVVATKRLAELRGAFTTWQSTTRQQSTTRLQAIQTLVAVTQRLQVKTQARAFRVLQSHARDAAFDEREHATRADHDAVHGRLRIACGRAGAGIVCALLKRHTDSQLRTAWHQWRDHVRAQATVQQRLTAASAMLTRLLQSHARASQVRAFSLWKLQVHFDAHRLASERAKGTQAELIEAKDCVFALSRAKTKLEDKLQLSRQDVQRASDQLREHRAELQLVKHGFVTTVVRETERAWLRSIFTEWRVQSQVEACARTFRLQLEMAELHVEERDKYARSLDDYNKVLRNDLERFQFFSQDKRIAVDVLTKKLLREEDTRKHMEEQHVALEEKMLAYKTQLASILDWQGGVSMPLALVHLCRDATVGNLRDLFQRLAMTSSFARDPHVSDNTQTDASDATTTASSSSRLAVTDLVQLLRDSGALHDAPSPVDLHTLVQRNVPEYATTQGLLFTDFVTSLNAIAKDAFADSDRPHELTKSFWSCLLSRLSSGNGSGSGGFVSRSSVVGGAGAHRDGGDPAALHHTTRSPWAGQLSEDILQNQEKLLAVLEHETAVVERAVMEKSSLKHTYAASEHSVASNSSTITTNNTVKEFQEYQCDPMVPPEQSFGTNSSALDTTASAFVGDGLVQFANWSQSGQIHDLFAAFRRPLERIVTKYSNEQRVAAHGNQICLVLSGVSRMLEDMRLYPAYLSRELVHHHFGLLSDRDGLLPPPQLAVFLGCCALELFAKSLPSSATSAFRLSAREIVLSFFCDLGFLTDSEIPPPPRICFVGMDVETVLWPLFEYYAISVADENDATSRTTMEAQQDPRVGMTIHKFRRFAGDIINVAPQAAERIFQRVINETRRTTSSTTTTSSSSSNSSSTAVKMHLDEFYVAIACVQEERCPGVQYANLGEAVRHWMQQTQ